MDVLRFTVLGCGSSGGVPRIGPTGPNWGACDPDNPKNRRTRCALLVQRVNDAGTTTVLIDAGADISGQLIREGVGLIDALILTHEHADHVHGLDDMRMVTFNRRQRIPAWMDARTEENMMQRFAYIFEQAPGSGYPAIMDRNVINGPLLIDGPGGEIEFKGFHVVHGDIMSMGFRIGPLAYIPDISEMTEAAWEAVAGVDCWILDALRWTRHPSHSHVEQSLEWIERVAPRRAYITDMHVDVDYDDLMARTPDNVEPAYDGLVVEYPL
ncbi:MBL fold metallo-hydrolase [Rhodobacteraceae bacterium NNCM2]|nr:MBL fold metallo-hydrolase [Coraliihabitans acroporae]